MKRFALAGLLIALTAATTAAQSVTLGDRSQPGDESSPQIIQGEDESPDTGLLPAAITENLQPVAGKGDDLASVGICNQCQRRWEDCCCNGHGWSFFGEWLLLQPRGADPVFAVRSENCFTPPLGTEQIDFGAFSGFKVGLAKELCDACSFIEASFTHFEANESEDAHNNPGVNIIRPVLLHPSLSTCDEATSTFARASASINFDRADVDYRHYMDCGCVRLDWLVGFAYGQLTQDLTADFDEDHVKVFSDLFGYGVKLGGGAEYGHSRIRGFGHLDLSLLASIGEASYTQTRIGGVAKEVAHFNQDLDRIVPVLDLEVGLAWDVCRNTVIKVGYMYSVWFNVVTTPDFVAAVQKGDVTGDVDNTLTFDGVFARVEFTW